MSDNVNHPSHYTRGKIECLNAIEEALGTDGFISYLQGNILKYVWRFKHKNGLEDLKKAAFYLNRMISTIEADYPAEEDLKEPAPERVLTPPHSNIVEKCVCRICVNKAEMNAKIQGPGSVLRIPHDWKPVEGCGCYSCTHERAKATLDKSKNPLT